MGYIGIVGIVFAESGLFFAFFLPGDSLLFTGGFLASQGYMDFATLMLSIAIAAIIGNIIGYGFGYKVGPKLFKKEDSLLFHKNHLNKAKNFYAKHGVKTIIIARFIPIIRTFAPILAGVGKMKFSTFIIYNILGGLLWTILLTSAGFYLGKTIPNIDQYLLPIIVTIIIISLIPSAIQLLKKEKMPPTEKVELQSTEDI